MDLGSRTSPIFHACVTQSREQNCVALVDVCPWVKWALPGFLVNKLMTQCWVLLT